MPVSIQLPSGWPALTEPSQGIAKGSGPIEGGNGQIQVVVITGASDAQSREQQLVKFVEQSGATVHMLENRTRQTSTGATVVSLVYEASAPLGTARWEVCFYPAQQYAIAVAFGAAPTQFDDAAVLRDALFRDRVQVP
jgi:hypothetical protein